MTQHWENSSHNVEQYYGDDSCMPEIWHKWQLSKPFDIRFIFMRLLILLNIFRRDYGRRSTTMPTDSNNGGRVMGSGFLLVRWRFPGWASDREDSTAPPSTQHMSEMSQMDSFTATDCKCVTAFRHLTGVTSAGGHLCKLSENLDPALPLFRCDLYLVPVTPTLMSCCHPGPGEGSMWRLINKKMRRRICQMRFTLLKALRDKHQRVFI